ncbi:MAG TPA: UDPGP type 1 family protein [Candidatus Udaeobacter sp.]|nr:UDPGP type 1 family protein [Candidatus Udaeobacter sp.]
MDNEFLKAETILNKYKQEHVLRFLERRTPEEKAQLFDQIQSVDFEQLVAILHKKDQHIEDNSANITPIPYEDWDKYDNNEQDAYTQLGWELIRSGRVAVIVVAGGQGSRLGHNGPKGTLDIGLPSRKSLFQLQAERLLNLSRRANKSIPWYIMTSPENHQETIAFFNSANYFGYPADECFFFQQNTMPVLDHEGKLMLTASSELRFAPSGNGECFSSLKRSGALADMKKRGVTWLFYYNVDNALIKVADPSFIGVAASHNNPIATKVIEKTNPDEKIGVVCLKNNVPAVVEYTEIPSYLLQARNHDGSLTYHAGNISIHLFRYDFVEHYADTHIPYHAASKRIDYVDSTGKLMKPEAPNAYKLERFIFDFFPLAPEVTVLKMRREEEFAPVKNKEGEDSPRSARNLVLKLHKKWLIKAGIPVEQLLSRAIEISPLVSISGEGLNQEIVEELVE